MLLKRSLPAAALAVVMAASAPALADECVARDAVGMIERALSSAASAEDPNERRRYFRLAARQMEKLKSNAPSTGVESAIVGYLEARRDDLDNLMSGDIDSPDPRLSLVMAASSFAAKPCREAENLMPQSYGGGFEGEANTAGEDAKEQAADSAMRDMRRAARAEVTRNVSRFVAEAAADPRSFLIFALIPFALIAYRLGVLLNRRRDVRYICCIPAEATVGGEKASGHLFDFSRQGGRLSLYHPVADEAKTATVRLDGLNIDAKIIWRERSVIGVEFAEPLGASELGQIFKLAENGAGLHRA